MKDTQAATAQSLWYVSLAVRAWGTMSKKIRVILSDGRTVICAIVEHSYRHGNDARAAWCSHNGREFVAALQRDGIWREWTAADRLTTVNSVSK